MSEENTSLLDSGHAPHRPAPLSVLQEQIWFFSQLAPDNPVYNEMFAVHHDGEDLDIAALRSAFNEFVRRHQILRSTFAELDSVPMQTVHPPPTWELPLLDLSAMPRAEAEQAAARLRVDDARRPYDLSTGPLIRPELVRIAADHHRLYLGLHHIVFDGVSLNRVLLPELEALYDDAAAGRAPSLPEPAIQYADFARHSGDGVGERELDERVAYWRRRLDGAPTLELPIDRRRPARQTFHGRMEQLPNLSRPLVERLRALSHDHGASLFQALAAAFAILLQRCTGQDDVVFGTIADLRQRYYVGLESMAGYCVTPLVLRADLHGEPSFLDVLQRIRTDLRGGLEHLLPFEVLVRELRPHREAGVNPLFQAMMVMQPARASGDSRWSVHHMDAAFATAVGTSKFDLSIDLDEESDGVIYGRLGYNPDIFETGTAQRLAGRWGRLLESIAGAPTAPITELAIVSEEAEQQQLAEWNHTDVDHPLDACLHELIAAQARRTPDAAVSDGRTRLSFAELDDRAGRLASRLGELGVGPEVLVGVCMQPSIDRLVALLGILRAGGAFLPLEPDQPRRRLELMLGEARPQLVLTTGEDCAALPASGAQLLRVDAERASWMASAPLTATGCAPHNLAYVLFTSGSTGTPKGVMVEHRSLVNQLLWAIDWFGITADDRMIQSTSLGFDPSLRELFCPLLSGASLRLLAQADHANPQRLARILGEERITVLACVPSMLEELIAAAAGAYPSLRLVSAGGEVLSPALVRSFFDRFGPAVELRNMYGPTETTVAVSGWRCEPDGEGTIPIGRPVANTQVHLLDARLAAVPIGSPGELCIGGVQVARGYLNRPDLTAERFVANPFRPGERLYRSGDMARHRSDGAIEFLGRRDAQVKIRGIRIELGELEAALARHPAVRQAVAALRRDAQDRQRLVAHVVAHRGHPAPTLAEVRAFLADSLPSSMLPSALVAVDHLPLTQSGKLDRAALPEPDWLRPAAQRAPRTPLEERMAALWARTLRLPRVGIDDDFFELGGHSLLAIRLLVAMEAELGVTVPLAAFLDGNASVAGACALLQPQDGGAQPRPDAGPAPGTRPTVFFVEPGDSAMLTLRHFTRAFGPEQRVVGLLPERRGARFDQSRSVEDLAAGILRTIQQTQPTGPYHLAGWSMGGLLAYEIAGQLRAAGEVVAWLALLDAGPPAFTRQAMQREMSLGQRLARQRQRGVASAVRHTGVVSKRELTAALVRLHLRRSRLGDDFDWRGAHRVASRYSCPGNDAPLDLFLTAPAVAEGPSASLGWEAIHRGPLHIHDIPGEHASMVTEPHVSVVADMLVRTLRRAQAHAEMPR